MSAALNEGAALCVRAALTPWLLDRPAPQVPRRESRVYFIQSGAHGPIKIGKADSPETRLAHLQVGCPSVLRLLGSVPGGLTEEAALHTQFASDRLRGEWFAPSGELLGYIADVTR